MWYACAEAAAEEADLEAEGDDDDDVENAGQAKAEPAAPQPSRSTSCDLLKYVSWLLWISHRGLHVELYMEHNYMSLCKHLFCGFAIPK